MNREELFLSRLLRGLVVMPEMQAVKEGNKVLEKQTSPE